MIKGKSASWGLLVWPTLVVSLCLVGPSNVRVQAQHKISFPEDLGSSEIDVSRYPPEYQKTYREIFLPVFTILGGPARQVNSPLIEMDPATEGVERVHHPALFSDPRLAQVSRDGWRKFVTQIRTRPPCCGACPVIDLEQSKALWRFLVYDSLARKTGHHAEAWIRQRKDLLQRFRKEYPEQFKELYEQHAELMKEEIR